MLARSVTGATERCPRIVVMGVSAAGKSTIGRHLAHALAVPFLDADDLHSADSVVKMAAGIPLDDRDREPWLESVAAATASAPRGIVVACSALRRLYRERIARVAPDIVFVHAHASRELLQARISHRLDHFMPAVLLDSQLATLEPLGSDERGFVVDASEEVELIVGVVLERLTQLGNRRVCPPSSCNGAPGTSRAQPSGGATPVS